MVETSCFEALSEAGFYGFTWQCFYGVLESLWLHFPGNLGRFHGYFSAASFVIFSQLFHNGLRCLLEMVLLQIFVQKSCCHRDFWTDFVMIFEVIF